MMRRWFGYGWAQPVEHRGWAFAATVTEWAKRATGRRAFNATHHRCWERACGLR